MNKTHRANALDDCAGGLHPPHPSHNTAAVMPEGAQRHSRAHAVRKWDNIRNDSVIVLRPVQQATYRGMQPTAAVVHDRLADVTSLYVQYCPVPVPPVPVPPVPVPPGVQGERTPLVTAVNCLRLHLLENLHAIFSHTGSCPSLMHVTAVSRRHHAANRRARSWFRAPGLSCGRDQEEGERPRQGGAAR